MPEAKTIELASKFLKSGQIKLARRLAQKSIQYDRDRIKHLESWGDAEEALEEIRELEALYKGINNGSYIQT
jgi:hypothetical protein